MNELIVVLSFVVIGTSGFFICVEFAHFMVLGWIIPEADLDAYLGKYLQVAQLNPYASERNLFCDVPQYISSSSQSFMAKWHIEDFGVIPRWSKWSKRLDERRAELLLTLPRKTLKDL